MAIRIFLDSDVVISSIISDLGAAHILIHTTENVDCHLSDISIREMSIVVKRLGLDEKKLKAIISKQCVLVKLKTTHTKIQKTYSRYVSDLFDAHIVAGAKESASRFLISYNTKHFHSDKLKVDFGILLMTPGQFLQYLRSLE